MRPLVRPLARTRAGQTIEATPSDATAYWTDGSHRLWAEVWEGLVPPDAKAVPPDAKAVPPDAKAVPPDAKAVPPDAKAVPPDAKAKPFRLMAIYDPRYPEPLLLASNLDVSAPALWRLYRDRWAIEQLPLSAKPMLGTERAFVSGQESRYRLPELALLAGSVLSYVAATEAPVASGFWDRAARPTCGRVRRALARVNCSDLRVNCSDLRVNCSDLRVNCSDLRVNCSDLRHCSELPVPAGQLRKKNSITAHLKTGVEAHRRHKTAQAPSQAARTAVLTGN